MWQEYSKMIGKAENLLTNVWGWVVMLFVGFVNFLGDEKTSFLVVGIAIIMDLFWGIWSAVKRGKYILSESGRDTFTKTFAYGSVLVLILLIEKLTHEGLFIATRTACVVASACELCSISAHILIIKPDFPFIRLFRKYLAGEISKKLDITVEEYYKTINQTKKNNDENEQGTTQQ